MGVVLAASLNSTCNLLPLYLTISDCGRLLSQVNSEAVGIALPVLKPHLVEGQNDLLSKATVPKQLTLLSLE